MARVRVYRFLCGMGIGGEYAAGVALVAESMPARARPFALGMVQAFSSVGAIIGSGLSLVVGPADADGPDGRLARAVLVRGDPQPAGRADPGPGQGAGTLAPRPRPGPIGRRIEDGPVIAASRSMQLGDLRAIFGDPSCGGGRLIGMTLGMVGQIGLWSIALFTPELVRGSLLAERRNRAGRDGHGSISAARPDLEARRPHRGRGSPPGRDLEARG